MSKGIRILDTFRIYAGTACSLVLGFVKSILVARILGPSQFGAWKLAELILTYGSVLGLGITSGMNRELPYWFGKEQYSNVRKVKNTGLAAVVVSSIVGFFLLFIAGSFFPTTIEKYTIQLSGLIFALSQVYGFFLSLQYAQKNFSRASILIVLNSVISLIVTVICVIQYKFLGQLVGMAISFLLMILITPWVAKLTFKFEVDEQVLRRMVTIGFPIMLIGVAQAAIYSIDRFLIIHYLDIKQLGYYGLGLMVMTFLIAVPDAVGQVLYPYINEHAGKFEKGTQMDHLVMLPLAVLTLLMPLLISVTMITLPWFVTRFMPDYGPGILAAQVLIIGLAVSGINVLHAFMKQKLCLLIQVLMIGLNLAMNVVLITRGYGLIGVALTSVTTSIIYKSILTVLSLRLMEKNLGYIVKTVMFSLTLPLILTAITLSSYRFVVAGYSSLPVVLYLVAIAAFALPTLARKQNVLEHLYRSIGLTMSTQ